MIKGKENNFLCRVFLLKGLFIFSIFLCFTLRSSAAVITNTVYSSGSVVIPVGVTSITLTGSGGSGVAGVASTQHASWWYDTESPAAAFCSTVFSPSQLDSAVGSPSGPPTVLTVTGSCGQAVTFTVASYTTSQVTFNSSPNGYPIYYIGGVYGDPAIPPTTGGNSTATINSNTYTYLGGYGGAATPSGQTVPLPGAGHTLSYTITSPGYLTYSYTNPEAPSFATSTATTGSGPVGIVISPDGLFAYTANQLAGTVSSYSRSPVTGSLSFIGAIAASTQPHSIKISPDGLSLYVANISGSVVSQYSRNTSTGVLTALGSPTVGAGTNTFDVIISPDGTSAYASSNGSGSVVQYSRNTTTGALTALAPASVAAGSFARGLAISPDGKFVYATNYGPSNSISQYSRSTSTGALTALAPASIAAGTYPYGIVISPDGISLYVTNETTNNISQYSRSTSTGALTALGSPTIASGLAPYGILVSPDGASVYAVNQTGNSVSQYSRSTSTGALTALASSTIATGSTPQQIAISPDGQYVYVSSYSTNDIYIHKRNMTTGALSPANTLTYVAGLGSATLGAAILSGGSNPITARGTCWGANPSPVTNCLAEGSTSTGAFTQSRTGLPPGTLIYFRGYVTSIAGAGYSSDGLFTTLAATTTLQTGTDPSNVTIGPGGSPTFVNSFTFQTSQATDTIQSLTLAIANASSTSKIEVTSDDGLTVYGSSTNATSSTVITLTNASLIASTTQVQYKLRITPKSQASLPSGALSQLYPVTAYVTSFISSSTNNKESSDTGLTTVTIDNIGPSANGDDARIWTSQSSSMNSNWQSVTYGNGLFVAVSNTGTTNRVMTSPDGVTWTTRTASDISFNSVAYGNGKFVAVGTSLFGRGVMYSADGITWVSAVAAADNNWTSVTYGNGLFVAVSNTGNRNRVMTSPNGIVWTIRSTPNNTNAWTSVTYGNNLYVAVANTGTGNRVMTSPNGIAWTMRTTPVNNNWTSVTYGNGYFVAVSNTGTGNRVMKSADGINWSTSTTPVDNNWTSVTSANGLFVAVANSGTGNRVMVSSDATTWSVRSSASDNDWRSVVYGNGNYVAVSNLYTANQVMVSSTQAPTLTPGDSQTSVNYTTAPDSDISQVLVLRSTSPITDTLVDGTTYTLGDSFGAPTGQAAYTTPGTYSWTAPAGVTSVSVVAVGGGGGGEGFGGSFGGGGALSYVNNIIVIPGQSYTVIVGAAGTGYSEGGGWFYGGNGGNSSFASSPIAGGGSRGASQLDGYYTIYGGAGGSVVSGTGGAGGRSSNSIEGAGASAGAGGAGGGGYAGGGGAGGYSGAGGNGYGYAGGPGNGGGVGILGLGSNGVAGTAGATAGIAGSGGTNVTFGGGGFASPGSGAVRIIWGPSRSFPSTNTGDLVASPGGATIACIDSTVSPSSQDSCVAGGLSNGTTYYFKVFAKDTYGNYSVGVAPTGVLTTVNVVPTLDQSGYQFFASSTSYTPGSSLAAVNTQATLENVGDVFRMRTTFHIGGNTLGINGKPLKLQYAQKVGTCDTSSVGESYQDISSITPISFYDTPALIDGNGLGVQSDITHGADAISNQTYVESSMFNNSSSSVVLGQDAKYDFSLYDNNAPANISYCIRAVTINGSTLDSYSYIPEVTTAPQQVQVSAYRFIKDDGSESAATALLSESSPFDNGFIQGDKARLRFTIANQIAQTSKKSYQLDYSSGSCSVWAPVPRTPDATTQPFRIEASPHISDSQVTSHISAMTVPGGKSFVAGKLQTFNNVTAPITLRANEYTEVEYNLRSTGSATAFTNYCFRISNLGTMTDITSLATPSITVFPTDYRRQGGGGIGGGIQAATIIQAEVSTATTSNTGGTVQSEIATSTIIEVKAIPQTQQSTTTPTRRRGGGGGVGSLNTSSGLASIYLRQGRESADSGQVLGVESSTMCTDLKSRMLYGSTDTTSNREVSQLQYFLKLGGYFNTTVTGNYLSITEEAVKAFQKDNNLIVTGIAGKVTREKMKDLGCVR